MMSDQRQAVVDLANELVYWLTWLVKQSEMPFVEYSKGDSLTYQEHRRLREYAEEEARKRTNQILVDKGYEMLSEDEWE